MNRLGPLLIAAILLVSCARPSSILAPKPEKAPDIPTSSEISIASKQDGGNKTPTGFYWPTEAGDPKTISGWTSNWLGAGCSWAHPKKTPTLPDYPDYRFGDVFHTGIDIGKEKGTKGEVYAIADGTVYTINRNTPADIEKGVDRKGWGLRNIAILVDHQLSDGSHFIAVYGHIQDDPKNKIHTGEQRKVYAGKPLGIMGPYDYGVHLHLGIHPGSTVSGMLGRLPCPPNGPIQDTNGFVDPYEWLVTKSPLNPNVLGASTELKTPAPSGQKAVEQSAQPGLQSAGLITQIASQFEYSCAVNSTGGVKCWGNNNEGQLGDGGTRSRNVPGDVVGLTNGVKAVSLGESHACALTSIGGVKCWGANDSGQMNDGTVGGYRLSPVDAIDFKSGVVTISSGFGHNCVITEAGGVKCWGRNDHGQLGDGNKIGRNFPEDVIGLTSGVIAISAGNFETCALSENGSLKCWGSNEHGQVGDGTNEDRATPVEVVGMSSGVIAVSVGYDHACALTSLGSVKCWGGNLNGQLGDGTTTDRLTPIDVTGLNSDVKAIGVGWSNSCAILSTGGLKCWGDKRLISSSVGAAYYALNPVDVPGLSSGVIEVSLGLYHACVLLQTGTVKCWGENNFGEIGDGTGKDRPEPVEAVFQAGSPEDNHPEKSNVLPDPATLDHNGVFLQTFSGFVELPQGYPSPENIPLDKIPIANLDTDPETRIYVIPSFDPMILSILVGYYNFSLQKFIPVSLLSGEFEQNNYRFKEIPSTTINEGLYCVQVSSLGAHSINEQSWWYFQVSRQKGMSEPTAVLKYHPLPMAQPGDPVMSQVPDHAGVFLRGKDRLIELPKGNPGTEGINPDDIPTIDSDAIFVVTMNGEEIDTNYITFGWYVSDKSRFSDFPVDYAGIKKTGGGYEIKIKEVQLPDGIYYIKTPGPVYSYFRIVHHP